MDQPPPAGAAITDDEEDGLLVGMHQDLKSLRELWIKLCHKAAEAGTENEAKRYFTLIEGTGKQIAGLQQQIADRELTLRTRAAIQATEKLSSDLVVNLQ